jgi:GTPase KRas protein
MSREIPRTPSVSNHVENIKLVVVGAGGVGKSCLAVQLVHQVYDDSEEYDPTIEDAYVKQVEIDDVLCRLDILDTAGQENFSALRDQYLHEGDGYLIVYSITERATFEEAAIFRTQILRVRDLPSVPMLLAGNKCDHVARKVSTAEGEDLAQSFGCPFLESSAKLRINVERIFFDLVREIRRQRVAAGAEKPASRPRKLTKYGCFLF